MDKYIAAVIPEALLRLFIHRWLWTKNYRRLDLGKKKR